MCSRWRGSMPLNGSSSSSTLGSWTRAPASFARWRMPFEYVPVGRCAASTRSTVSIARCAAAPRVRDALELRVEQRELVAGQVRVDRLLLGNQAHVAVDLRLAPGRPAADEDLPGGRLQQAGHQVQQRGLARAVRPEQARDAGAEGERHVVDRDDVAVPARDVVQLERRRRIGGCAARRGRLRCAPSPARRARSCADPEVASDRQRRRSDDPDDGGARRTRGPGRSSAATTGLSGMTS